MPHPVPLQSGRYYHIYNRGNNRENIFREERNYRHFLNLYTKHILPVADTYAYCLLRNHFHLLVRIKDPGNTPEPKKTNKPSQHFSNLFNAYAKAFNRTYQRTGSLFQRPFGRIEITSDAYFIQVVIYIHRNPQKHGFVDDFRTWPHSSYHTLLSTQPTRLQRDEVLEWFQGVEPFVDMHRHEPDESQIAPFIPQDLWT